MLIQKKLTQISTVPENIIKRNLSILLLVYFLVTIFLRLSGWGSILFFFDMQFKYNVLRFKSNPTNNWGNILFYLLPLFIFIYSTKRKNNIAIMNLYCLLEGLHLGASFLGIPYFLMLIFKPSVPNIINLIRTFFWNSSVLILLSFLFKQCINKVCELNNIYDNESTGRDKKNKTHYFLQLLVGTGVVFCYIAPFLPFELF